MARDNVLVAGTANSGAAIVQAGTSATATLTHNMLFNLATTFSGTATPTSIANQTAGAWPFAALPNPPSHTDLLSNHSLTLTPTVQAVQGYDGSTERGVHGGSDVVPFSLHPEPVWP